MVETAQAGRRCDLLVAFANALHTICTSQRSRSLTSMNERNSV